MRFIPFVGIYAAADPSGLRTCRCFVTGIFKAACGRESRTLASNFFSFFSSIFFCLYFFSFFFSPLIFFSSPEQPRICFIPPFPLPGLTAGSVPPEPASVAHPHCSVPAALVQGIRYVPFSAGFRSRAKRRP